MADGCFSTPRSYAPPAKSKRLSEDALKSSADRLSMRNRKDVDLPPLVEKRTLTADVMTRSLDRLYDTSVQGKKRMLEELDKKQHPDMVKHTTLDQEAMEGMFNRLYTQSVAQKQSNLKGLEKKYLHETASKTTMSKEQIKASANRLCNESADGSKEKQQALFDKYVLQTAPKFGRLSKAEVKASGDRLSSKNN
jgi:hypothetical protein